MCVISTGGSFTGKVGKCTRSDIINDRWFHTQCNYLATPPVDENKFSIFARETCDWALKSVAAVGVVKPNICDFDCQRRWPFSVHNSAAEL